MFGMGLALMNPTRSIGSGGLPLIHTETFASAPSIGTDYNVRFSSPSVSHNSTNQSLIISGAATNNLVSWDKWSAQSGAVAYEMDFRLNYDASVKHFGFFLNSASSGSIGYRVVELTATTLRLDTTVGATATVVGSFTTSASPVIVVGTTYTIRVERDASGVWSVYLNGVIQGATITDSTYANLRAGFFVYENQMEVFELRVYG